MADALASPPAEDVADVDERGTLDVRLRAIQRVIERVVLDTPGTVAHTTALGRVGGRRSPQVDVRVHGRSARVSVRTACVWPAPVAAIAARVREAVREEAARVTGVAIPSVDVTVYAVAPSAAEGAGRRRVE